MKNKRVIAYLDGGWKVEGVLLKKEDGKLFLENDGDVYMVFKDKISCMLIGGQEKNKDSIDGKMHKKYDNARSDVGTNPPDRIYSGLEDGMSGVSLPSDILLEDPDKKDNDFSVFFTDGSKKINVTSEE